MDRNDLNITPAKVKREIKIKVQSTSVPKDRPDFYTWCKEFKVSTLYNREDHWLDFEIDKEAIKVYLKHRD